MSHMCRCYKSNHVLQRLHQFKTNCVPKTASVGKDSVVVHCAMYQCDSLPPTTWLNDAILDTMMSYQRVPVRCR